VSPRAVTEITNGFRFLTKGPMFSGLFSAPSYPSYSVSLDPNKG
jgi:hypothetical protein